MNAERLLLGILIPKAHHHHHHHHYAADDDAKYSRFINSFNVSAWRSRLIGFRT